MTHPHPVVPPTYPPDPPDPPDPDPVAFDTAQINDAVLATTGGPSINEGELAWYKGGGSNFDDLQDAEQDFLFLTGQDLANLNDMWFGYLGSLGYSGALSDRKLAFWIAGGGP